MTPDEYNPPAFPFEHGHSPDAANVREPGMDLRDWFAGQALVAYLSNANFTKTSDWTTQLCAEMAYQYADAMLKQRTL